nr:hypothetical protein [Bartonella taylorii]
MTSSFATLLGLSFLFSVIMGFLSNVLILSIYYLFFKRARLYCKVKKELKKVLQERDAMVEKQVK